MIKTELLRKYNIKPFGYQKANSAVIVITKEEKYVFKEKNAGKTELFNYLKSRSFLNFPEIINQDSDDNYDIFRYYDNYDLSVEEKGLDLVNLISLLHNKTTHYRNIDIDNYKIIYEKLDKKISHLTNYYKDINDLIDREIYMSPSNYLLIRNISKINALLGYCKNELDDWYELIKDLKKERVSLIHNNIELDHLIRNENSYLISWDKAKLDLPIYDMYNFYKKNYKDLEFGEMLSIYERRYPLNDAERKLLFIMMSIPQKLEFDKNEYENTKKVNDLLYYIYKTDRLISPYYPENEEEKDN